MIFAEIEYEQHYSELHAELVGFIKESFTHVEHRLQGDSWIWVFEKDEKVEVDTFSSMQHQIKSSTKESILLDALLKHIGSQYKLKRYAEPEFEGHE